MGVSSHIVIGWGFLIEADATKNLGELFNRLTPFLDIDSARFGDYDSEDETANENRKFGDWSIYADNDLDLEHHQHLLLVRQDTVTHKAKKNGKEGGFGGRLKSDWHARLVPTAEAISDAEDIRKILAEYSECRVDSKTFINHITPQVCVYHFFD